MFVSHEKAETRLSLRRASDTKTTVKSFFVFRILITMQIHVGRTSTLPDPTNGSGDIRLNRTTMDEFICVKKVRFLVYLENEKNIYDWARVLYCVKVFMM